MALPLLLGQLAVVLVAARLAGLLLRRFGQPRVVGEMLAGLALGPSLFGGDRA
jgi:Kef-type K+ transport system membrane component KefB